MWRESVNGALRRLTGHELRRSGAEESGPAVVASLTAELDRTNARLERTRQRLKETRARLERTRTRLRKAEARSRKAERRAAQPKPKPTKVMPSHYDENAAAILRRVEPRTMTDYGKLFALVEATRYIARSKIPGDIVECGVWRGGSMQAVALALLEEGVSDRGLHLFDTFEGMTPPTEKDRREGVPAEELLASRDKDHRIWAVAGLDDVQEAMREVAYPEELVHFHRGRVEDTVPALAPARIALLRLDTDWYESTKHELEHLYDRLVPGGVLIIDDYGDWEGARQATDEFFAGLPEPVLLIPAGSGRIAVKAGA